MHKVSEADIGFIHALMNDESVMAALNEPPTPASIWTDAIAEWAQDDDEEDYIICHDDEPAGWVGINGLSSGDKCTYVKVMALLPAYRGRGTGEQILCGIIQDLESRGYASLRLHTDKANIPAQRCYAKCGFEIVEELEQRMSNGAIVDRYKMERRLNGTQDET